MRRSLAFFLPLAMLAPDVARAADGAEQGFSIKGSIRARFEGIDGQFRPNVDDTVALLLRTDIEAAYRTGPITIGAELQDARAYFEHDRSSVSTTEVNALEPVQAYVAADLGGNASIEGGRFTMDIGSRRLVARNNFRNTTNSFTGARFDWKPAKGTQLTAFWTMPQTRLPDDRESLLDNDVHLDKERDEQQFFGASAVVGHVLGGSLEGYAYRLYERDAPGFLTRNRHLWTLGGRLFVAPKKGQWDYEVEAAYQTGSTHASAAATDLTRLNVAAGFAHAIVGYTFASPWQPRIAVAYDYASGDGRGRDYGRFDTLFGARVFEFGPTSFYGPVSRANLSSPAVRAEVKPDARWDAYVAVRGLWLARATDSFASTGVRDATGRSGRYAGVQYDTRARYWLIPKTVQLSAGGAILAKGRFLSDAPNAPRNGDTHYGFFEATYNF